MFRHLYFIQSLLLDNTLFYINVLNLRRQNHIYSLTKILLLLLQNKIKWQYLLVSFVQNIRYPWSNTKEKCWYMLGRYLQWLKCIKTITNLRVCCASHPSIWCLRSPIFHNLSFIPSVQWTCILVLPRYFTNQIAISLTYCLKSICIWWRS